MSGYALESDLDRANVSVRELEGQIANLKRELKATDEWVAENAEAGNKAFDTVAGWLLGLLSNLYEDPFPPATEAEWDEAHAMNAEMDDALDQETVADFIMSIPGYYRDEADCRCSCCKGRGK